MSWIAVFCHPPDLVPGIEPLTAPTWGLVRAELMQVLQGWMQEMALPPHERACIVHDCTVALARLATATPDRRCALVVGCYVIDLSPTHYVHPTAVPGRTNVVLPLPRDVRAA